MPCSLALPSRRALPAILLALGLLALLLALPGPAPAGAQASLVAYTMVDQWPERAAAAAGLFQSPIDLELAADGSVLVADRGVGGVHRLLPSGAFTTPFGTAGGFPAQLGQVGPITVGPAPGAAGERLYALDTAVDRVVIYALDGAYVGQWEGITAQSLVASSDGRVYVLDREASAVRALDAASGAERFRFGTRGTEPGQFANFTDVDITADGRILVVSDLRGARVQLWNLADDAAIAGGAEAAALRDHIDLNESRFNKTDMTCRAPRVNALGGDRLFLGQGEQACIVDGRTVSAAIATSANKGTICRATVRLPRLRPEGAQYFALATSDPNAGACGEKKQDLETSTVVARYNDELLRAVRTVWEAADNDAVEGRLFAPQALSMPAPDRVFVRDNSPELRFYSAEGALLASVARDSSARDLGTDFEVTRTSAEIGSELTGEIYAAYSKVRRQGEQFSAESGIGRFKAVETRTAQGTEAVIEPIWTVAYGGAGGAGGGRFQRTVTGLAYNPVSGELLVLRNDGVAQQRTLDMRLLRYGQDGRPIEPAWDVPDDGLNDPYSDLAVGPDGRVYLLDDLDDKVLVYASDGQALAEVPVAPDARAIAGGPPGAAGSVFALRETGAIERYRDDGTVSARLDGRAVVFSDPTFISDMVVDGQGRVFVADGQASLISVFLPTDDPTVLPVPDDGACSFVGRKTAAPERLKLGEAVTVTLELSGTCGVNEAPSDIVIVVPYFQTLQQGRDRSGMIIGNLLGLGRRLNFDQHRVGIVSYYQTRKLELDLTDDRDAYIEAVRNITRQDPPTADIKPRLKDAMEEAQGLFQAGSGRRQVMVLVGALYCDPNDQRRPVDCTGYPPAEEAAQAIREAGTQIVVAFGGSAANLASSDEDVVNGFEDAHRRIVDYRLPELVARDIVLTDHVPANMRVDPASIGAGGTWTDPTVTWRPAPMGFELLTFDFRLVPQAAGRWPTNVSAKAELVDGWGLFHEVLFPLPEVEVIGPSPTPPPPTATPTLGPPPTATPLPTATSQPGGTVYLPWLVKNLCVPKAAAMDIVLAVDASTSMSGAKHAAAVEAIGAFLDAARLAPDADRAAVVDFAEEARLLSGLSADRAQLDRALAAIETRPGTRIDRGLEAALAVLAERRPAAHPVLILLSDGRQEEDPSTAIAAGERARAAGIEVFAVGLGADVDAALLAQVAQTPDHYLAAPSPENLRTVYADIASRLTGCP